MLEDILLKSSNIDINIGNQIGDTPIHIASYYGHTNLIEILLAHGADVNKLNHISENSLYEAACGDHIQAVKLLLNHGAKISNYENSSLFDKILDGIITEKYNSEIITILFDYSSIEERNEIFIESCKKGKIKLVNNLLSKYKVDPNLILRDGYIAILQDNHNSTKITELLVKAGDLEIQQWENILKIPLDKTGLINLPSQYVMTQSIIELPDSTISVDNTYSQIKNKNDKSQQRVRLTGISNNQPQQIDIIKKSIYIALISSPFIAVGIYATVAFTAGIEFNPIIASGIFIGVAVAAIACFAITKISEKVSRTKDNNPDIDELIVLENIRTPEYVPNNWLSI